MTLSARALRPELFIVARVRVEESEEKLRRAGADRVVNPQSIGGARMAAFVLQPHVTEFLDVVMHDRGIEFRLEEIAVPDGSPIEGRSIREAHIRDRTGALVLALREQRRRVHYEPAAGDRDPSRPGDHRDRHAGGSPDVGAARHRGTASLPVSRVRRRAGRQSWTYA